MVPDDTSQRGLDYTCDNDLDRSDLSPSMQLALNYHATRSELLRVHSSVMTYEVRKKRGNICLAMHKSVDDPRVQP